MSSEEKENELVHKLENLHQYLIGGVLIGGDDNSSIRFSEAATALNEIIKFIRENECDE